MNTFLNKIHQVCNDFVNEQGHFDLFACIELVSNKGEWDIVVCADAWLPKRKKLAINLIMDKIEQVLNKDDLLNLARVIVLTKEDCFYKELSALIENGEINNHISVAGLEIKRIAVLKTSIAGTEISISTVYKELVELNHEIHNITRKSSSSLKPVQFENFSPLHQKSNFEVKQNNILLHSDYSKHKRRIVCH